MNKIVNPTYDKNTGMVVDVDNLDEKRFMTPKGIKLSFNELLQSGLSPSQIAVNYQLNQRKFVPKDTSIQEEPVEKIQGKGISINADKPEPTLIDRKKSVDNLIKNLTQKKEETNDKYKTIETLKDISTTVKTPKSKYSESEINKERVPDTKLKENTVALEKGGYISMKAKAKNSIKRMADGGKIKLSPEDEKRFQDFINTNPNVRQWKQQYIDVNGKPPDIDNMPFIDLRKAFLMGNVPTHDENGILDWDEQGVNDHYIEMNRRNEKESKINERKIKGHEPIHEDGKVKQTLNEGVDEDGDEFEEYNDADVTPTGNLRLKKGGKIKKMYGGGEVALDTLESTAGMAGTGAMTGMAMGAVGGPLGAGIGAAVGLGLGLTKGIIKYNSSLDAEHMAQAQAEEEAKQKATQDGLATYLASRKPFKKGGPIYKAKGGIITGKEGIDKIDMDGKIGGFIVPVKNADKAIAIRQKYLGEKELPVAKKSNSGDVQPLKVTKDEVYFTPKEVKKLEAQGVDLNMLAPDAEKNTFKAKCGGRIKAMYTGGPLEYSDNLLKDPLDYTMNIGLDEEKKYETAPVYKKGLTVQPENPEVSDLWKNKKELSINQNAVDAETNRLNNLKTVDPSKIDLGIGIKKPGFFSADNPNLGMNIATGVTGLATVAGGINGIVQEVEAKNALKALGKEPARTIPGSLIAARQNAFTDSLYGYDQYNKQEALGDIATEEANSLVGVEDGGSGTDYARRMQVAVNANKARLGFAAKDASLKEEKKNRLMQMDLRLAGAEDAVNTAQIEAYRRKEEAAANLELAGTHNIYGATDRLLGLAQNYQQMQFYKQMFKAV